MAKTIKNEQKYQDYTYRLVEMRDEMEKAVANIQEVKEQQTLLCKVIQTSAEAKTFDVFLEQSKTQLENLEEQLGTLFNRIEELSLVITLINENGETVRRPISLLLEALGIFKNDDTAKPVDIAGQANPEEACTNAVVDAE